MSQPLVQVLAAMGGHDRTLAAGEYLFSLDGRVDALFVVIEGRVHLVRHREDGGAIVLQRAGPGDVLAEASLFSARYHCDAIAHSASRVRGVPKRDLRDRFAHDPAFAEAWAAHLAHEIQAARFRSELLSLRTVADRLDAWLAWYGGIPPKGERSQFADQIGVSPEALYRELARRRSA